MSTTTGTTSGTAVSADGSMIGWTRVGSGPPVIQVDGALCWREMGPAAAVAEELKGDFTVYSYDRRGRGTSTEAGPYDVRREIEDLAAVIGVAGGSADLFGQSSGAALAAHAAAQDVGVRRLALFEAPFVVDGTRPPAADDLVDRFERLIADGKRGAAVKLFLKEVGVPGPVVVMMGLMPVFSKLKSVAHTLPHDFRVLGADRRGRPLPAQQWAGATMPALVMAGGKSPDSMKNAQLAFAQALPNAEHRILPGQTHMLKAKAVAPVLTEFFSR
jgi:pimeloyl-ACP methyl ester carboxylesterase